LEKNERVLVIGAAEQFVRKTFWRDAGAFDDVEQCAQELLTMVGIES